MRSLVKPVVAQAKQTGAGSCEMSLGAARSPIPNFSPGPEDTALYDELMMRQIPLAAGTQTAGYDLAIRRPDEKAPVSR